jgi:hypothetical protein
MAENIQRSTGRDSNYKYDRGGMPTDFGPFIGIVKNNVDPIRAGRLQVYIEEFGGDNPEDSNLWRTVSYLSPFYGQTPSYADGTSPGAYLGNPHSYGMWFTPPDIGVRVMCFFVGGDPSQGWYIGCLPNPGILHMIPAVGSSEKWTTDLPTQDTFLEVAKSLPVAELNENNTSVAENPQFFYSERPVHAYAALTYFQQGLLTDTVRGPIASTSQRESPSTVYGISTPGQPIYEGGYNQRDIRKQIEAGSATPESVKVVGRQGGHTFVMDDGDLEGEDALLRLRTSKGHQITLSDSGSCIYIIHANGQAWIEIGAEGTLDVFATNSVNIRTQGTINMHADKDINMYAGGNVSVKANVAIQTESVGKTTIRSKDQINVYSESPITVLSDGTLACKGSSGASFDGGPVAKVNGGTVELNTSGSFATQPVKILTKTNMPEVKFDGKEWKQDGTFESIVTRAPTHEPWPNHNAGVSVEVTYGQGASTPAGTPAPRGWNVQRTL